MSDHAIVWIDDRLAKIFEFLRNDARVGNPHISGAPRLIHRKPGGNDAREDEDYLRAVTQALAGLGEILIIGPGHEKWQLRAHINLHAPLLSQRVMAVAHADHPSDDEITESAQKYFSRIGRMTPQPTTANR